MHYIGFCIKRTRHNRTDFLGYLLAAEDNTFALIKQHRSSSYLLSEKHIRSKIPPKEGNTFDWRGLFTPEDARKEFPGNWHSALLSPDEMPARKTEERIEIGDRAIDTRPLHLPFRDQAALAAMRCICVPAADFNFGTPVIRQPELAHFARQAFDIADAMEAERLKRLEGTCPSITT